jgi:hypothetical protein
MAREALKGMLDGQLLRGYSAYAIAVQAGYQGTKEERLESLKGHTPEKGTDYWTAEDVAGIARDVEAVLRKERVTSLTDTSLAVGSTIIEAVGIPVYVSDLTPYAEFGITEPGWYVFAKITAPDGVTVSEDTIIEGDAGHIVTAGDDHVSVAVRFEVAAMAQKVVVTWSTDKVETFVFSANDLAVRNLDYRVTFYVYDIDEFATWSYAQTTDAKFLDTKAYYVKQDGEYVKADVVINDPVPAAFYVYVPHYTLTTDETFVDGTTYYHKDSDNYVEAEVTVGEHVTAYFVHSKVRFEGMTRNITYRCDTMIDCPVEFVLPEIEDNCHGAWFEIRFRHSGSFSSTLIPPSSDVRVATEHTQAETAGMNMVDLHYSDTAGAKVWRFMNTHSNFTAAAPALESIAFRTPPTTTAYNAGAPLDLTGADVIATYADGSRKNVTASCTFTPAANTALTTENTELEASYTEGDVTVTATVPLVVL